ncbi:hypothetical protein E1293_43330 [Actinomadura darangshiensis]|uniref:Guanylate cyclase domain-containing protein n=1 Tax=Actinomadura darangshiensis TaxID=705336 RepID=A0A4R4ZVS2_9ACTN|nr:hypothetical protein [Actinomadura darangshiensis]TDD63318.1 hypothetical protein E1293_43330 [Actinomadura darangshiensis]
MEAFRALLVVDAEKFSAHRDADLTAVHLEIRRVLATACRESGLGETWEDVRFSESTGDGVLAILPLEASPALIDPFPRRLQEALASAAPGLRARGLRLRLRVALHIGLVDDEHPEAPGISTATIDVNRLLDAGPLRDALKRSDPEVTFVAVIVSAELFATYVAGGRTGLRESQFMRVQVQVKQFDRPAYLHVPAPSGRDEPPAEPLEGPGPESAGTSISGITISGNGSQNAIGNTAGGDFRQERS